MNFQSVRIPTEFSSIIQVEATDFGLKFNIQKEEIFAPAHELTAIFTISTFGISCALETAVDGDLTLLKVKEQSGEGLFFVDIVEVMEPGQLTPQLVEEPGQRTPDGRTLRCTPV